MRWWQIRKRDADLERELRSDLELEEEEQRENGLPPQEAHYAAQRAFGNTTLIKEQTREAWGGMWIDRLLRDLRYALRQLASAPGFTLTAVLTLAIGIGGVTAVFSVVLAVLLRPLPFKDSGRLISLHEHIEGDSHDLSVTAPDVLTFERESKAFSGVGGFVGSGYELTGAGAPFKARAERVTASLFPLLGIDPMLGRTFTRQEDDDALPVTVISYALWKERFHSDPNVLGTKVDLDRRPYVIVGVMPRSFEFPLDAGRLSHRDLWVPMSFSPEEAKSEGDNFDYSAIARLKPGITMSQAQQDVDRVMAGIQAQYPAKSGVKLHAGFVPLREEVIHNARPILRILLGAVALILLIACANLANLLLVRAASRRRELGMRMALGAARKTLFRQLLTESLALSCLGGAAGTALAVVLVRFAAAKLPDSLPRVSEIGVSWPLLFAAVLLTGATGLLCGLAPAIQSTRGDVLDSLRDGGRGAGHSRRQSHLRSGMVVLEVGLAMVLLVSSGLLLRSFAKMLAVDPGFQSSHVLTASLALPTLDYPNQQKVDTFFASLQRRLESDPGVKSVGFSSNIPIVGQNSGRMIAPEGYIAKPGEGMTLASNYLTQGNYFEAIRIPLIRGRYFGVSDDQPGTPLVTVISQSLAKRYFPGKDPIGLRIKVGQDFASPMPTMTVVGVVGDIKQGARDEAIVPQMYEPLAQVARDLGPFAAMIGVVGDMDLVIRTTGDPAGLVNALNSTVHQLDPLLPVANVSTMDEIVAATESSRRFNTVILTSFAGIALSLSLLGIYGVMAYSVSERTSEIAIRMALGATRQSVLLKTLRHAFSLTVLGGTIGLAASLGLTRLLSGLLYNVKPLDVSVMISALILLFVCSSLAALIPARRAASVEPMRALRSE
ncbi:MAG TPA: ABC transporter permease [Terracidiphilus sp.]|jgi:putative ABC transport system permease protein